MNRGKTPGNFEFIMAVKLRLKRVGARNTPFYRIVATDTRTKRDGRPIEELGTYNPVAPDEPNFTINLERAEYWLGTGAQPSDTVRSFIRKARRAAKGLPPKESKPKKQPKPEPAPEEPKAEEPVAEAAPTEEPTAEAEETPASAQTEEAPEETPAADETAEEAPVEEPAEEPAAEGEEKQSDESA